MMFLSMVKAHDYTLTVNYNYNPSSNVVLKKKIKMESNDESSCGEMLIKKKSSKYEIVGKLIDCNNENQLSGDETYQIDMKGDASNMDDLFTKNQDKLTLRTATIDDVINGLEFYNDVKFMSLQDLINNPNVERQINFSSDKKLKIAKKKIQGKFEWIHVQVTTNFII